MEDKKLKDCTTWELIKELRERSEIISVTIWNKEDIKVALKEEGYIPTEERVDEVIDKLSDYLEDCSSGWETISQTIWNCDFGEQDYEE